MNHCYLSRWLVLLFFLSALPLIGHSQCEAIVPSINIDLTGTPDSTWILLESNAPERDGHCCAVSGSRRCIRFELTLDPNTAGILFSYDGAPAFGSLTWQLDCGPEHNLRDTICISGVGPHTITFCKSGSDNGNYTIQAVARPTFPTDQVVPKGCIRPLEALGVTNGSISWTSVYPGAPGQYNGLLSCVDCPNPVFTPDPNGPDSIRYTVCGYPILSHCTGSFQFCGTFAVSVLDSLKLELSPPGTTFCSGGSATITASGSGGDGNYTYFWYDGNMNLLSTSPVLTTSVPGTYTAEVREGHYQPGICGGVFRTISIGESFPPLVDAGNDQMVCSTSPGVVLNGSVTNATGGTWSGGLGTFIPSGSSTTTQYIPSPAELQSGSVTLTLTSTGFGQGCSAASDQLTIYYSDTLETTLDNVLLNCKNDSLVLNPSITGGTAPLLYEWSNGATTPSIYAEEGNYCLAITDAFGCNLVRCVSVLAPPPLVLNLFSTPASLNGASDGTASVIASGGTPLFSFLWNTGSTTPLITGLPYGIYTVVATDTKGCQMNGSIVVNEPLCLGFDVSVSGQHVLCHNEASGSATAIISGGQAPFSILWDDPAAQTTATASNLSTGVYTVRVTDNNGCIAIENYVVNQPQLLLTNLVSTDVTTVGGADGLASAIVSGGTAPYGVSWNNGATDVALTGLAAGSYTITVTDANGCIHQDSVILHEPSCTNYVAVTGTTDPTCNGSADGTALLNIVNGVAPYTISWSNGASNTTALTGLDAGVYTVTVTDSRNCITFRNFAIQEPDPLTLAVDMTAVSCYGENNGTLDLSVNGGTFPVYTFSWSNGATTEDLINLAPGNYVILVTDENGCTATLSQQVTEPAAIVVSHASVDVTCNGLSNGSIDLTAAGGVFPYSYSWSNGSFSQDLTGIDGGGYLLNFHDANNCGLPGPYSILIHEPDQLNVTPVVTSDFNGHPVSCNSSSDGVAFAGVTGGTSPYTYLWSNGQTASTANGIPAGSYTVQVLDSNGCSASNGLTLVPPTMLQPAASVTSDYNGAEISCHGLANGSLSGAASGGIAPYSSVWTDQLATVVGTGTSVSGLPAGTYTLTVTDLNLCSALSTITLSEPAPVNGSVTIASDFNGSAISCHGLSDAALAISASGGVAAYDFDLLNSGGIQVGSGASPNGLGAGSYSAVVTDVNGCTISLPITISEPAPVNGSVTIVSDFNGSAISCHGLSDAALAISASGGVAAYDFDLLNSGGIQVGSGASPNGLGAGSYSAVVTDVNGCTISLPITISEPAPVNGSVTIASDFNGSAISCHGLSDAALAILASGGVAAYDFDLLNSSGTQVGSGASPNGLGAGSYSAVVTDVNGCTISLPITISEPAPVNGSVTIVSDFNGSAISCHGLSDAALAISASGGVAAYDFDLLNSGGIQVGSGASPNGLGAGTYSAVVTDVNGCTISLPITISEPATLSGSVTIASDFNGSAISCHGLSDAALAISAAGGIAAYDFDLLNSGGIQVGSGAAPNGLGAGTYSAVVTDVNGCTISLPIMISEPATLSGSVTITSNFNGSAISCHGLSDAALAISASGGVAAYDFDLLNSGGIQVGSGAAPSGLGAGTYSAVVTDVNGCTISLPIMISEPATLSGSVTIVSDFNGSAISCHGLSDAALAISASGGIAAYDFDLLNSSGTQVGSGASPNGLGAGTYSAVVTDVNGCTISLPITISEPATLSGSVTIASDFNGSAISCHGLSDAALAISASGGIAAYDFDLLNSSGTQVGSGASPNGLGAGTYSAVVTDVNGCTISLPITISEPESMSSDADVTSNYNGTPISCHGLNDGAAAITTLGGTGIYTSIWLDNTGDTICNCTDPQNLQAGHYTIHVYDANGCSTVSFVDLSEPDPLQSEISSFVLYNGQEISCFGLSDGALIVEAEGGTTAYSYQWTDILHALLSVDSILDSIPSGGYNVLVTDVNGCQSVASFTVVDPLELSLDHDVSNATCNDLNDGFIELVVEGGTGQITYEWNNGATSEDLDSLQSGSYSVTITDLNGCSDSLQSIVVNPTNMVLSLDVTNASCNDFTDGAVELTATGGMLPYNILWNTNETSQHILGLGAGAYSVTVTDSNNCRQTISCQVTEPDTLQGTVSTVNVSCFNSADGSASVLVIGGTAPYDYLWSNGSITPGASGLGEGVASVAITDANGCIISSQSVISQPDSLWASMAPFVYGNGSHVSYTGESDGSIDLSVYGGSPGYLFQWDIGSETEDISGLQAGVYTVTITDQNGCQVLLSATLSEPMDFLIPEVFSPNGDDYNDVFAIRGIEQFPENDLTIYNRWGAVVFETDHYQNNWDGHSQNDLNVGGDQLPSGVYYYVFNYSGKAAESLQARGSVLIKR